MEQFETHGWVRISGAFSRDEAAAMRDVVWRALDAVGIRRDDPSTWQKERPDHLQHLKSDPAFRAVGSDRTRAAIDEVLHGQPWRRPFDWGARAEEVDGIPLQVVENTASAGDVILMHPLLLHAPPTAHLGSAPRFLLNKDIYL